MANHHKTTATPEDRGAVWALAYQEAHVPEGELGFVATIVEELKGGELDGCLAKELVLASLNGIPQTKKDKRQAAGITRAVEFAQQMSGRDEIDDDLIKAMTNPRTLALWSADAKQVLTEKRIEIREAVEGNLRSSIKELRDRGFIFPKPDRQTVEAGMAQYFKKIEKRNVASEGMASVLKRKRMPQTESFNGSVEITEPQKERKVFKKRFKNQIVTIDKNGNETKLDATGLKELSKSYCKNNADFEQDVGRIFDYLKKVNTQMDQIPGIQKLTGKTITIAGKVFDLLEYKHVAAEGFSASTKLTKDMRIYLIREGNKFGILRFGRRDQQALDLKVLT